MSCRVSNCSFLNLFLGWRQQNTSLIAAVLNWHSKAWVGRGGGGGRREIWSWVRLFWEPLFNLICTYFFIHYPTQYLVLHPEHNKKGRCNLHPYARWQLSNSSHCHPLGRTPAFRASGLNLQTSWSETKLIWFLYGSWMPLTKFHNYFS